MRIKGNLSHCVFWGSNLETEMWYFLQSVHDDYYFDFLWQYRCILGNLMQVCNKEFSLIVNITSTNFLMESFHYNFHGILIWFFNGKENQEAGIISSELKKKQRNMILSYSMATEETKTKTTTAWRLITLGIIINKNLSLPFQTSLHKIFKNCFLWIKSCFTTFTFRVTFTK